MAHALIRLVLFTSTLLELTCGVPRVDYYYHLYSSDDAAYVVSQLAPAFTRLGQHVNWGQFIPVGVHIKEDDNAIIHCEPVDLCPSVLVHYCIGGKVARDEFVTFLQCFYENEVFPDNPVKSTRDCFQSKQVEWSSIEECAASSDTQFNYAAVLWQSALFRPQLNQTPYVRVDGEHSPLAQINLGAFICQSAQTEPACRSEEFQLKSLYPTVHIFYKPFEQASSNFFQNSLFPIDQALRLAQSTHLLLVPYRTDPFQCQDCWPFKAELCVTMMNRPIEKVLNFLKCTVDKSDQLTQTEIIKSCIQVESISETELEQCIQSNGFQVEYSKIAGLMQYLKIDTQNLPVISINEEANSKARNKIASELCDNYFEAAIVPLCEVKPPQLQLFYETPFTSEDKKTIANFINNEIVSYIQLAPFETILELELIPYGRTQYNNDKASYQCQSEEQCESNWIQGCLIQKRFQTVDQRYAVLKVLICTLVESDESSPVVNRLEACVNQHFDDGPNLWIQLILCAHDTTIRDELRSKTETIGQINSVIEVVLSGTRLNQTNKLLPRVCSTFDKVNPRECRIVENQTLDVTLYLSGERATRDFIVQKVNPLLTSGSGDELRFRDIVDWQLVPWGLSQYNDTSKRITCSNGAKECLVLRVLTCGVEQARSRLGVDRTQAVAFVACFFSESTWESNPMASANQCANQVFRFDTYALIWQCIKQEDKLYTFLRMRDDTEANGFTSFPAVKIAGKANGGAVNNLVKSLCDSYEGFPKPKECSGLNGATSHSGSLALFSALLLHLAVGLFV